MGTMTEIHDPSVIVIVMMDNFLFIQYLLYVGAILSVLEQGVFVHLILIITRKKPLLPHFMR